MVDSEARGYNRDRAEITIPEGIIIDWYVNRKRCHFFIFLGPRFPFEPKDLAYLQKKTDTLTGRELSRPITVEGKSHTASAGIGRGARRRDRESLREYGWRIEADDDNLNEDILAPKHSSF